MMLAAADLKLPLNLIGVIPSAENMPGPEAYRPGDIITTRDGKTIEVLNTDAEGRIILADAIAHARLTYKPAAILEFSTLTGACIMALGHKRAGMFTSSRLLGDAFTAAGKLTGELVWPLPIDDEYKENVLSEIATAKNTSFREGSACSSASFVKLWAEETPFVHFDIARHRVDHEAARASRRRRNRLRPAVDDRGAAGRVAGVGERSRVAVALRATGSAISRPPEARLRHASSPAHGVRGLPDRLGSRRIAAPSRARLQVRVGTESDSPELISGGRK